MASHARSYLSACRWDGVRRLPLVPTVRKSVRCHQTGAQLDVELLKHRVVDGRVRADEEDRVSLICCSEDLAHALRRTIEALELDQVDSAFGVLLTAVDRKPVEAELSDLAQHRIALDDLALAETDVQGLAVDQHVEGHENFAAQRRQQRADDLHRFLPIMLTEGSILHGWPNEVVVLPRKGRALRYGRAIGSPCPAPIKAGPHLQRRRREDATWQTTQPALAAPAPSPQEEQAGDPVASRIVYAVAAIGVACLLALCYFAPQLVEGLQHGGR